jgi:hypothetical protein
VLGVKDNLDLHRAVVNLNAVHLGCRLGGGVGLAESDGADTARNTIRAVREQDLLDRANGLGEVILTVY